MQRIICIDPGPTSSGVVCLGADGRIVSALPDCDNTMLREWDCLRDQALADRVIIEKIESYGMAVGASVFDTCVEIGRFVELADTAPGRVILLPRREVKLALCGSSRAKDANVRQALIDLYPATGGGRVPQVGTRARPGPLYGVNGHAWSALALGRAWLMTEEARRLLRS